MYIIFLKFGPQRAQASDWMAGHVQWIQQGIDDGVFLMAGSLEAGQGGAILAAGGDRETLMARVRQDPFVEHQVATAEVHAITPSRTAPSLAALLAQAPALS